MKTYLLYSISSLIVLFGLFCVCRPCSAINIITPVISHDKNDPDYKTYMEAKEERPLFIRNIINNDPDTVYVATTGNDLTGNGSYESPFLTIQRGIDETENGNILVVKNGTYLGSGNINILVEKSITITSENGTDNCIIDCENSANSCGFFVGWAAHAIIEGFTIKNGTGYNVAYGGTLGGGGIVCQYSWATLRNNRISHCSSNGIFEQFSHIIIENSVITDCDGYGVYGDYDVIESYNNIITMNGSGGIWMYESYILISNNLIYDNAGYGVTKWNDTSMDVTNSTITRNEFSLFSSTDEYTTIINAILWSNAPFEIYLEDGIWGVGQINVSFSDIRGGIESINHINPYPGVEPEINWLGGNIDLNPLFIDPENDFHLSDISPCIGAGTAENTPSTDIEGNPRGTPPDIGACENQLDTPKMLAIVTPDGSETWDAGTSQNITWSSENVEHVSICYSTNAGADWKTIVENVDASVGSYSWVVPNEPSTECLVRISDVLNPDVCDQCGDFFTIQSVAETVLIDIKPGSCHNPVNVRSQGVLPVVLYGSEEIDVADIDPATITLSGISPERWSVGDAGCGNDGMPCDCTIAGCDGFDDMLLTFDAMEVIASLENVHDGDRVELTLDAKLENETEIEGKDYIVILSKGKHGISKIASSVPEVFELSQNMPNPFNPQTTIRYSVPTGYSDHVRLNVYDIRGALVRTLVDHVHAPGVYSVVWNGTDMTGSRISSGVYIYQLEANNFVDTHKMIFVR